MANIAPSPALRSVSGATLKSLVVCCCSEMHVTAILCCTLSARMMMHSQTVGEKGRLDLDHALAHLSLTELKEKNQHRRKQIRKVSVTEGMCGVRA